MNASLSKLLLIPALAITMLVVCGTALAQGTATGPATGHIVDPGPIVVIGDPVSPIPIDLDTLGPPWTKGISDPNGAVTAPGTMDMVEYILNVGTEPWLDWHEHILQPPAGLPQSTWASVTGLFINGNPITFTSTGLGTPNLWMENFSQPVLPGDILLIEKKVNVFPTTVGSGGPLMRIEEYPTPEPASAALMGLGSLLLMARRKGTAG